DSQDKLQEIRRHFTRTPDLSILLWLYFCWCSGADVDVFLDRQEAKRLRRLSYVAAIDSRIGRRAGTLTLWTRLAWSVREAYGARGLPPHRRGWSTKLQGVEYLTELTMADVLFGKSRNRSFLHDPDAAFCTWRIWQEFTASAPPHYAEELASITWRRDLKVQKVQTYVWNFTASPPPQHGLSYVGMQREECAASRGGPCSSCREELGRNWCELECGHEFHRECLRTGLQQRSSTCPICRDYAVLPADVPGRPARNNSRRHKAKPWKRSFF
ncbi:DZIP3 ligase, partial [Locustella ochotensis]|nr:DZIP3 ligase [Locustella ochotensis]